MKRMGVLLRWLGLELFLSVPLAAAAALFLPWKRLWLAPAFIAVLLIVLAVFAEKLLAKIHGCSFSLVRANADAGAAGLRRSLERAVDGMTSGLPLPAIVTFPDPSPNVLVLRAFGSRGVILASRGLLSALDENEFRAVLSDCWRRSGELGLTLRCVCAILSMGLLSIAPKGWKRLVLTGRTDGRGAGGHTGSLTAGGFLGFLALMPAARALVRIGGSADSSAVEKGTPAFEDALRKLRAASNQWPLSNHPAASALYLHSPWGDRAVWSLR